MHEALAFHMKTTQYLLNLHIDGLSGTSMPLYHHDHRVPQYKHHLELPPPSVAKEIHFPLANMHSQLQKDELVEMLRYKCHIILEVNEHTYLTSILHEVIGLIHSKGELPKCSALQGLMPQRTFKRSVPFARLEDGSKLPLELSNGENFPIPHKINLTSCISMPYF